MFDFASNHYWFSASLARRLNLQGKKDDFTLNSFSSTHIFSTADLVEVTLSADTINPDYTFILSAYVKDEINDGTQKFNIPALQEKYPYLEPIKPVRYSYSEIEMVIGQDFYLHIRPLDYFHDADRKTPMAFRLPVGWVLSGPLPSSSGLLSTCFRCKAEDVELVSQVEAWYELKKYWHIQTS